MYLAEKKNHLFLAGGIFRSFEKDIPKPEL